MTVRVRTCESLQPGVVESDLLAKLGEPLRRDERDNYAWLYFEYDLAAAGPIRARIDSMGKVVTLRCHEDGPVTWSIEKLQCRTKHWST